jgi:hypothetical protein
MAKCAHALGITLFNNAIGQYQIRAKRAGLGRQFTREAIV